MEIVWIAAKFVILATTVVMHLMKEVAMKKGLVRMIILEHVEVYSTSTYFHEIFVYINKF